MIGTTAISQVKSGLMAALIAVLVWVFAEGESVSTRSVVAAVSFPAEIASDLVIRPDDPNFRGSASVTLQGTTRTLELAAAAVSSRVRLVPGSPGVPGKPGRDQVVDLREAINAMPELQGLGCSVLDISPRQIIVNVVHLVRREVPVRVDLSGRAAAAAVEGDPVVTPPTVTVRLAEEDAPRISEGVSATAVIPDPDVRRLASDGMLSLVGVVRLPASVAWIQPMVVTPEQVLVTLRAKREVDTLKVPTVPVWFSLPPTEDSGKWEVTLQDKFITDVTLTGPADELAKIRSGQFPLKAMIELTTEDLEKGVASKPARFVDLPPGVAATSESRLVRLASIKKRTAPPPGGTP